MQFKILGVGSFTGNYINSFTKSSTRARTIKYPGKNIRVNWGLNWKTVNIRTPSNPIYGFPQPTVDWRVARILHSNTQIMGKSPSKLTRPPIIANMVMLNLNYIGVEGLNLHVIYFVLMSVVLSYRLREYFSQHNVTTYKGPALYSRPACRLSSRATSLCSCFFPSPNQQRLSREHDAAQGTCQNKAMEKTSPSEAISIFVLQLSMQFKSLQQRGG